MTISANVGSGPIARCGPAKMGTRDAAASHDRFDPVLRNELARLAGLIDRDWFEREWAAFFPARSGQPAAHPRLVAGLMSLQHIHGLSGEAMVACWVENLFDGNSTPHAVF